MFLSPACMAKEKRETVYHKEHIYTAFCTAIALQSIHLLHCIAIFFHQPTLAYIYTTPGRYRIDRSLLKAVAVGLDLPLLATVRPIYSDKLAQPLLQLSSVFNEPCNRKNF